MLPPSFPQRSRNCGLCGTASDTIPKNHCLRRFPACILLRYRPAITVSIRYDLLKPASPAHSVIKLRDVFTVSFPRASHQPAAFCAFPLQLLIPFNTFSFLFILHYRHFDGNCQHWKISLCQLGLSDVLQIFFNIFLINSFTLRSHT